VREKKEGGEKRNPFKNNITIMIRIHDQVQFNNIIISEPKLNLPQTMQKSTIKIHIHSRCKLILQQHPIKIKYLIYIFKKQLQNIHTCQDDWFHSY